MSDQQIYKLIRLFVRLLGMVPKPVLKLFSDMLGMVWYLLDKRHRNVVLENVRLAYPGRFSKAQLRGFARYNFRHTAGILFDVIWSYGRTTDVLFSHFDLKGLDNLDTAMKKGRGVIALTCHMGNFEMLVPAIAKAGYKPYLLYRKLDFDPLEQMVKDLRQRFGLTVIPLRGASQKIEAHLKKGRLVGTLLDQNVDWYKGVFVDFFGRPACTNNGLAKVALKTGSPVVPVFIMEKDNTYIVEFFPELPLVETGDRIKDIEINTQNYVSAVEYMVRQCPEQYFWVHNRWKTKPYCLLNRQ